MFWSSARNASAWSLARMAWSWTSRRYRPSSSSTPRLVDQASEDVLQRRGRALELDHLPRQLVDPTRDGGAATEDLVLNLVDVVLEPGDDRRVAVDDVVDDRVHDRQRAPPEQIRARLESPPHGPELGRVAVAHGDDELRADEDRDLAEHDRLRLVDVASRPQDEEQVCRRSARASGADAP